MTRLDEAIQKAVEIGIKKAMFDMEAHSVRLCPVDTGRLRASIKIRWEGSSIFLSADTEYAEYVEFGTVNMSAQPFIRPALFKAIKDFIPKRVIAEVRKVAI